MRASRETIMAALLNALSASVRTTFAADTQANSGVLSNPTTTSGLFVGLPVFGGSIPRGAVISSLSPLTVSLPATANARQAHLATGFQTIGRRVIPWQQVSAQPALFLRSIEEELDYPGTVLQRMTMKAEIFIYSNAGSDPDVVPETALNNLLDAVQNAFAPDSPMQMYTLGGLVEWCRITGKIVKDTGDLDGQASAVVEVDITVP